MKSPKRKSISTLLFIMFICIAALAAYITYLYAGYFTDKQSDDITTSFAYNTREVTAKLPLTDYDFDEYDYEEAEESEVETETEAVSEAASSPFPIPFTYKGTKRLNIRSNPSLSDNIIGKVLPNTGGIITGVANDKWMKVEYNGTSGYCYTNLLIYDKTAIP